MTKPVNQIYNFVHAPIVDNEEPYPHYPLTHAVSQQIEPMYQVTEPGVSKNFLLWGNRGQGESTSSQTGNVTTFPQYKTPDGVQIKAFYDTRNQANAATRIVLASVLGGLSEGYVETVAGNNGLTLAYRDQNPEQYINDNKFNNVVLMPTQPLPSDVESVVIDYEVADGRSACDNLEFLGLLAGICHRNDKKFIVFTNALNAATADHTNVAEVADRLLNIVDGLTVQLFHGTPSGSIDQAFKDQIKIIEGCCGPACNKPEKLIPMFEMNNTSPEDAVHTRQNMADFDIDKIWLWRNYLSPGQGDYNEKRDILTL